MKPDKYGYRYPSSLPSEEEKYLPSFFLELPIQDELHQIEVRPLTKDKGYYTINMNNVFLAHIHKLGDSWCDFLGKSDEIYRAVGALIDEHLKRN